MEGIADTIAAISGPADGAARCVVRLSGATARTVALDVCGGRDAEAFASRGVRVVTVQVRPFQRVREVRVLAACMIGPRTATGEDVVEFLLPSGLARDLLARACECGARPAQAGEFSLRAYLNGQLTLEEAEGVAATIAATEEDGLRAARRLRSGTLGRACDDVQRQVLAALALVEAGIDFTEEEDVVPIAAADLRSRCVDWLAQCGTLSSRTIHEESISALPRVVLWGPANAGKSTLFNHLLGYERAVAADVAGTTRDALVERWSVDGGTYQCELVDLPGVPPDNDPFAASARVVVARELQSAALVLACQRADDPTTLDGHALDPGLPASRLLALGTCADAGRSSLHGRLAVSARTGAGIIELREAIAQRLARWRGAGALPEIRQRHIQALTRAGSSLQRAVCLLDGADHAVPSPELVAECLRESLCALGEVSGRLASDAVLGEIFARFCVGK